MGRTLTKQTFFQYITCPSWVYFDANKEEKRTRNDLLMRLQEDGLLRDQQRALLQKETDLYEITSEDPEIGFRETLEAMNGGRSVILSPFLVNGHWVGRPDLLRRVEGRSHLGDFYYVAVDMRRHPLSGIGLQTSKWQACFYADLLGFLQGTRPHQGYLLDRVGNSHTFSLEESEGGYANTVLQIERILAGHRPEHRFSSACKHSPWFDICAEETHHAQDLSLLNRITRAEMMALQGAGFASIERLATADWGMLVSRTPTLSRERLDQLAVQARARKEGKVIVRLPLELPKRKEGALFFDIEQHPVRDLTYLFGVLEETPTGSTYHSFVAQHKEDERTMWEAFQRFWSDRSHLPVFHYGSFEKEMVQRFQRDYGLLSELEGAAERHFVDLLPLLRSAVVLPIPFYSLKDIAALLGFHWRDKEASGAQSVLWCETWLQTGAASDLDRILEYNEDDVRATALLTHWLIDQASAPGEIVL